MAYKRRLKRSAARVESCDTSSTIVGPAFELRERGPGFAALDEEVPIDFQARQDSIAPTRRSPSGKLAPKIKKTSAKPAPAKETKVKL